MENKTIENSDGYSFATGKKPKKKAVKRASSLKRTLPSAKKKMSLKKSGGLFSGAKKKIASFKKGKEAEARNIAQQVKSINKSPSYKLPPPPKIAKDKPMSMAMKAGIGAGIALVLGLIGFGIYKATK